MQIIRLFQTQYGTALIVNGIVGIILCGLVWRKHRLPWRALAVFAPLAALLSVCGARAYQILVTEVVMGMLGRSGMFFNANPFVYAFSGAVLGVMAALVLTGMVCRVPFGRLADAVSVPGLVLIMLCRLAEVWTDFGWGALVEAAWAQRIPLAVQDTVWEEWHLAVFNLEALLAAAAIVPVLLRRSRASGSAFGTALLWWAMGQIFSETLRVESIRWGFIPVQQIQCAVFGLAVGIIFAWRAGRRGKGLVLPCVIYLAGVGVVAFLEFALDKCPWPQWIDYVGMAAVLVCMGCTIQRMIDGNMTEKETVRK